MRIALGVEYDGRHYHGWQRQEPGVATVQEKVEDALSRVANTRVRVVSAGRTDAGVHATGQVVHFDTAVERATRSWVFGANANLPDDVAVRWATPVPDHFHARFSAVSRSYRYIICSDPVRPALSRYQVTWNPRELDIERMRAALPWLRGRHDFSAYRSVHCQSQSPVRTLDHLGLYQQGPLLVLEARADAFLMHMVRNIAGVLMSIGSGRREPGWAGEVLAARDRRLGGVTAPPWGLYLVRIGYPAEFALPAHRLGPLGLPDAFCSSPHGHGGEGQDDPIPGGI
jgi:tRNA pseudouridine38-40 synthase